MKNIKYIVHYDVDNNEGRNHVPAATNKADYIFEALSHNGYHVDVISACLSSSKGYFGGSKKDITENITLTKLPAFKRGNIAQRVLARIWSNIALFVYLIFNIKRNEEVIVYHSLALISVIKWVKRIKNISLVLETEEIYSDVINGSNRIKNKELKFIDKADKYIFPTELLNEKLNDKNKPYILIHGTYRAEPDRKVSFNDDKIHVVYAGTFDPRKGGVYAAISAAAMLTGEYHMHIIGFGSSADIANVKKKTEEINDKSRAEVTYDGLITGEEYIRFLQKCQIGLSTQNPDAAFNATSFPSKILSYMANGLRVVTVRIPAIEGSAIGDCVYYYDEQTPENIAKAIMEINLNDGYDGRKRIREIDSEFIERLKGFLGK